MFNEALDTYSLIVQNKQCVAPVPPPAGIDHRIHTLILVPDNPRSPPLLPAKGTPNLGVYV